ncbi:MAG TPA: DUF4157 domain-containing protein, partial [Pyrinomonadaceae bacterium]|nr:DUF4157 domain-containing protein [Pyrinomonadaceae bacterium]
MSEHAAAAAPPEKVTAPAIATKQDERLLRRKCACGGGSAGLTGACKDCDENRLRVQRRALTSTRTFGPTNLVTDVLAEEGQDLDESTRIFMETELGHDFRRVRVHTNARASDSARAVNALAYTVGSDIVFASGSYQPHAHAGRHLIAHELVHTLQQNSQPRGQQAKLEIGEENDGFEREADQIADNVMRRSFTGAVPQPPSPPQLPTSSVAPLIQRTPATEASAKPEGSESATPVPSLIVEDDAAELGPGQMRKSQFLDELRAAACTAADTELKRVGRSTEACPYIARAFERYRTFEPHRLERGLRRYAPEAAGATSASQYIAAVGARVGRAVGVWATTGEITDVPEELKGEFGVAGVLGGVLSGIGSVVGGLFGGIGKALGGIGKLFFKARAGGARDEDVDPEEIKSQLGSGQALDAPLRSRMEGAFGHDFSRVRVHANTQAAVLTSSLNARAFTVGTDVGFAAGEYKPGTLIGDALIAHELAHVVQQGDSAQNTAAPMKKETGANSDVLEQDADESAVGAVASIWGGVKHGLTKVSRKAMPRLKSGLQLQRCSHDYEVNGLSTENAPDSIFFDRRSASIDDSQQKKIENLKSPADRKLRLYAFVSEDENIPPASGAETAHERYVRVDEALRKGPNRHKGDQIAGDSTSPGEDTKSSRGNLNYRNMRKVKVVPASVTSSGEKDCSAGGEQPCSDESKFTSAQTKAPTLLDPAINAISSPLSDSAKKLLDTYFHTTDDATRDMAASVIRDNLNNVKTHITTQMTPVGTEGTSTVAGKPGHVCANECDPSCGGSTVAYNVDRDADALMTLCDSGTSSAFMSQADETDRALTLIHEGLHGITIVRAPTGGPAPAPSGAKDLAYEWQRVIKYLDTPTALRNNDSYVLFISAVNGLSTKSGADIIDDPEVGEQASRAVAFLQGWLIWAHQEIRALYGVINESRTAGSWSNSYYADTMTRIAGLFEMTVPPATPTE